MITQHAADKNKQGSTKLRAEVSLYSLDLRPQTNAEESLILGGRRASCQPPSRSLSGSQDAIFSVDQYADYLLVSCYSRQYNGTENHTELLGAYHPREIRAGPVTTVYFPTKWK